MLKFLNKDEKIEYVSPPEVTLYVVLKHGAGTHTFTVEIGDSSPKDHAFEEVFKDYISGTNPFIEIDSDNGKTVIPRVNITYMFTEY